MSKRKQIPTEFDGRIREASEKYLPAIDWRLLKAQYWVSSRFDPFAKSPLGARGIAQLGPNTWRDVCCHLPFTPMEAYDPTPSIEAGAWYMAYLQRQWYLPRPDIDRYCLALASYQAGLTPIMQAQTVSNGRLDYARIMKSLRLVTGCQSTQTLKYAPKVYKTYLRLVGQHGQ